MVPKYQTGPDIGLEKLAFISDPPRLMLEMKSGTPPVIDVFIETPVQGLGFAQPVAQSPQLYAIAITGPGNISALAGQQAVLTIKTDSQFREIGSIIPGFFLRHRAAGYLPRCYLFCWLLLQAG